MTYVELKNSIQLNALGSSLLVIQYNDTPFVAYQYVQEISKSKGLEICYIDDIIHLETAIVDIFGTREISEGLRVFSTPEFKSSSELLKGEENLVILTKKIDADTKKMFEPFLCELPKLETWHVKDFVYSQCEGVDTAELDWLISACSEDMHRLENECAKLSLFEMSERKYIFDDMKFQGAFRDLSTFNVFNITNSVTGRDYKTLVNALKEIKSFDAEPLGIVTLLVQGFRKLIQVLLSNNPTPETTGLKSNVIYAIRKSPRVYTNKQIIDAFLFLTDIDRMLKTGMIDTKWLVDYVICKVLTV